jgi:hypothetical protein
MEDGAFLGRVLHCVVSGDLAIKDAVHIYENARMPRAHLKQQVSFLNGVIWQLPDGPEQAVRWEPIKLPLWNPGRIIGAGMSLFDPLPRLMPRVLDPNNL